LGPGIFLLCITFAFSPCSHKSVSEDLRAGRGIPNGTDHGRAVHLLFCCIFMFWFVMVLGLVLALMPNELGPKGNMKKHKKTPPTQSNQTKTGNQKDIIKDCTVLEGVDPAVLKVRAIPTSVSE